MNEPTNDDTNNTSSLHRMIKSICNNTDLVYTFPQTIAIIAFVGGIFCYIGAAASEIAMYSSSASITFSLGGLILYLRLEQILRNKNRTTISD